jgi:hypothetical protein
MTERPPETDTERAAAARGRLLGRLMILLLGLLVLAYIVPLFLRH